MNQSTSHNFLDFYKIIYEFSSPGNSNENDRLLESEFSGSKQGAMRTNSVKTSKVVLQWIPQYWEKRRTNEQAILPGVKFPTKKKKVAKSNRKISNQNGNDYFPKFMKHGFWRDVEKKWIVATLE